MKFAVKTFGCQMNEVESNGLKNALLRKGFIEADIKSAEVVFVNSCSIRKHAEEKMISFVGRLKKSRKKVFVFGCVARTLNDRLKKIGADYIAAYDEESVLKDNFGITFEEIDSYPDFKNGYARVIIMKGCSMNCSFCIVPFVKGKKQDIDRKKIIDRIIELNKSGVYNIELLGQTVNSYTDFPGLLMEILTKTSTRSLRFLTSHPKFFTSRLIDVLKDTRINLNPLHIPIQSGSDRILSLMRRGYTVKEYFDIVERIKKLRGDAVFSTDIIVGFPSETLEDFNATLKAIETLKPRPAYVFKFSPRPFTLAYGLKPLPLDVVSSRHKIALEAVKSFN